MNDVSPARRSFWRFSLRELLLLMVAVAAFLGWGGLLYQQYRAFEPTPFFANNQTWQQDVVAIYRQLGDDAFQRASGSTTECNGTASASRTFVYNIPLPPTQR